MEAMRLIETESGAGARDDKWKEDEGENVLRLNPEEELLQHRERYTFVETDDVPDTNQG